MSIPSRVPSGRHQVVATWKDKKGRTVPAKTFTFDVDNPMYGKALSDPDIDMLKKQFKNARIVMLQQGAPCKELKIKEYAGCGDAKIHSTHKVHDRNSDFCNYGGTDELQAGNYGQTLRTLIKFDVSQLPEKAKVKAAYLKLYSHKAPGRSGKGWPHGKFVYQIFKPWGEGIGNGSIFDKVNGRIREGECSWLASKHPLKWDKPGCSEPGKDRAPEPVAESACPDQTKDKKGKAQPVAQVWVKWDITKAVAQWVKDAKSNNGLLIAVSETEGKSWNDRIGRGALFFRSSEYFDPPFRPKLIIVYDK